MRSGFKVCYSKIVGGTDLFALKYLLKQNPKKNINIAKKFFSQRTASSDEILDKDDQASSVLHSHWSRNVEARLSLVETFIVLLRQLSYAIKNQLVASKALVGGILLAPR